METTIHQTLVALFVALGEAAGTGVLDRANMRVRAALAAGAIDDPGAVQLLRSIASDDKGPSATKRAGAKRNKVAA
jgi:hypothetical protein